MTGMGQANKNFQRNPDSIVMPPRGLMSVKPGEKSEVRIKRELEESRKLQENVSNKCSHDAANRLRQEIDRDIYRVWFEFRDLANVRQALGVLAGAGVFMDFEETVIKSGVSRNGIVVDREKNRIELGLRDDVKPGEVISRVADALGKDPRSIESGAKRESPQVYVRESDFEGVNVVLHKGFRDGIGDFVTTVNSGYLMKSIYPGKTVRVIVNHEEDWQVFRKMKLIGEIRDGEDKKVVDGIEFINRAGNPEAIRDGDVSMVVVVYPDEKDFQRTWDEFRNSGKPAETLLFLHEVGMEPGWLDPVRSGNMHMGFLEDFVGIPPISPKFQGYANRAASMGSGEYLQERRRVAGKIPGLGDLADLSKIASSGWGFTYAHETRSIESYYKGLEGALKNKVFAGLPTTIFFVYPGGKKDSVGVRRDFDGIIEPFDCSFYDYEQESGRVKPVRESSSGLVIVGLSSVPRKLYSELFTLSHERPSVISGQTNLANMLYLNTISPDSPSLGGGRAFRWETRQWQHGVDFQFRHTLSRIDPKLEDQYKSITQTWENPLYEENNARMFHDHDSLRPVFHAIGCGISRRYDTASWWDLSLRRNVAKNFGYTSMQDRWFTKE